ncbi:MAG: InlB B-repeat-containing protein, partial [Bacilli bacterium]|nr:InlB B-repeat-containing protein [Bacilli bacterium]
MKRLKSLMLLLVLIPCMLLFTACGGNDKNNNVNNNGNNNGNNGGGNPSLNYTVTFMVNDTVYDTKQVSSGGKVENPTTDPTQNDKIFVGWYNGETAWNFASDVVTKDITLTAKFLGEFDEDNFKVIATKEQLIAYASNVENYEVNARLYADIDLGGMEWTPIGDMDNGEFYMAIFDGNGHTISNYTITKEVKVDEENLTVGFFTALDDGAIVHNLHLKNYTINVNDNVTLYEVLSIDQKLNNITA